MTQQNPTNWIYFIIYLFDNCSKGCRLVIFHVTIRATMVGLIMQFHLSWTLLNFIVTSKCWYCYPNSILFIFQKKHTYERKLKYIRANNDGKTVTETDLFKYIEMDKRNSKSQWRYTHIQSWQFALLLTTWNDLCYTVTHTGAPFSIATTF